MSLILFLHVPKCAGKSLREAYGDEAELFYNNPLKKPDFKKYSQPWRESCSTAQNPLRGSRKQKSSTAILALMFLTHCPKGGDAWSRAFSA